MKKLVLLIALALLLLDVGVATGGSTPKYPTKLKIAKVNTTAKRGVHYFHGRVRSEKRACIRSRSILMYRKNEGGGASFLGESTSDSDGKWTFEIQLFPPGEYFAKTGVVGHGGEHSFVCKAAKSNTYTRE